MFEYGAVFTLVGSDGFTVVFNDGLSGLVLEDCTGFDSPNVRTNIEDLPETDGAEAGDSWYGQRPVTLKGRVGVNLTAAQRNVAITGLQRALRGLRGDLTLQSTPTGLPAQQVTGRFESLRVSGAFLKDFLISIICPDPRIYSQTLHTTTQTQSQAPAVPGAKWSFSWPISFGGSGAGYSVSYSVSNAGNFGALPLFRVWGPIVNPEIRNGTTGESLFLDSVTLASGEWIEVDVRSRSAIKSDGGNYYGNVRFPGSDWWTMQPGSTTVQLYGLSTTSATQLDTEWRDCWL